MNMEPFKQLIRPCKTALNHSILSTQRSVRVSLAQVFLLRSVEQSQRHSKRSAQFSVRSRSIQIQMSSPEFPMRMMKTKKMRKTYPIKHLKQTYIFFMTILISCFFRPGLLNMQSGAPAPKNLPARPTAMFRPRSACQITFQLSAYKTRLGSGH